MSLMNIQPKFNPDSIDDGVSRKRNTLRDLVMIVSSRLGRNIDVTETRALGYLIEREAAGADNALTADALFESLVGVSKEDDPRAVAWKIQSKIFGLKTEHCQALEAAAKSPEDARKQKAVLDFMASSRQSAELSYKAGDANVGIGAVPEYLLPDWAKMP